MSADPVAEAAVPAPSGSAKPDAVDGLGERVLLLPSLVNRGLEANDRAKYLLTLLQAAQAHAEDPACPYSSLRDERLAAGMDDEALDDVVGRSRRGEGDVFLIPRVREVHDALALAVAEMLVPLTAGGAEDRIDASRLELLIDAAPNLVAGAVPGGYLDRVTSADPEAGDSFHLLIMDAHRALNHLQTEIATETLDGAFVYRLADSDRALISAFMAGLHATSPLKFDHPGLGTTATRAGRRLLIQNDIGETAAHVIVVTVEDLVVSVTYTDVHLQRLYFFEGMFDHFAVEWSEAQRRRGGTSLGSHHLVIGRYVAPDPTSLLAYLRHLGSRLVFLIDWNRARKRLVTLVGKKNAAGVLRWAADADLGHRAFLQLGGERLIYDAVELAAKVPARYGEPLQEVLGAQATLEVVRFALRASAEGLRDGKSPQLIRDELRVELLRHVQAAQDTLLAAAADHAGLIVETAQLLRTALLRVGTSDSDAFLRRAADRAAAWEHRADEILSGVRVAARRVEGGDRLAVLLATGDDAIDSLEEALFLLTLLPADAIGVARPVLDAVAGVAVAAAREHLKALLIARDVVDGARADEMEDFLVAVDRVMTLEHDADKADREARATLITASPDFRILYVAETVSRNIEEATDALLRSALGLRDHILREAAAP